MQELDINDVVNGLLDQIAQQSKEIAMLRVQLGLFVQKAQEAAQQVKDETAGGDTEDGS